MMKTEVAALLISQDNKRSAVVVLITELPLEGTEIKRPTSCSNFQNHLLEVCDSAANVQPNFTYHPNIFTRAPKQNGTGFC